MRRSIDLLQAVLDGTTDVIFVKDLAGKYLFINRIGAHLVGKLIDEVVGQDDASLFGSQVAASIRAIDEKVIAEGGTITYEQPGPLLAADLFRFRDGPGTRLLLDQLGEFPRGDHDDGPDAIGQACWLLSDSMPTISLPGRR